MMKLFGWLILSLNVICAVWMWSIGSPIGLGNAFVAAWLAHSMYMSWDEL